MANIDKNEYSLKDVKEYVGEHTNNYFISNSIEVVNINMESFNNGTSRDYPFCHSIKHPETGETLYPVRGFVGVNEKGEDRCYYAEYRSTKGEVYSYIYRFPIYDNMGRRLIERKSVGQQQDEDLKEYATKFRKSEDPGQMGEN